MVFEERRQTVGHRRKRNFVGGGEGGRATELNGPSIMGLPKILPQESLQFWTLSL